MLYAYRLLKATSLLHEHRLLKVASLFHVHRSLDPGDPFALGNLFDSFARFAPVHIDVFTPCYTQIFDHCTIIVPFI
jgi:hypothetical protein